MDEWTFAHTVQTEAEPAEPSSGTNANVNSVNNTVFRSQQLQQLQHSVPVPSATSKYLLLVSGLQIGNPTTTTTTKATSASTATTSNASASVTNGASELSAQLLIDFVSGRLGAESADLDIASKIVR